ncbi:MAG: fibronectin type III domain-containing protein [Candidatus Pacebacteria bacterium]|nr:fibronectin type III domain-containing protein [Candidatus Paceibacterota bacterium]
MALCLFSVTQAQNTSGSLNPVNTSTISHNQALLEGAVVGSSNPVFVYAECRIGSGNWNTVSDTLTLNAPTPTAVQIFAQNLSGNTTYECRLATYLLDTAQNSIGANVSNTRTFTTLLAPQVPVTSNATVINPTLTTLTVRFNYVCGNTPTTYTIRYGTSPLVPQSVDVVVAGSGTTDVLLTNLNPATLYYVEIQGYNSLFFFGNVATATGTTTTPVGPMGSLINIIPADYSIQMDVIIIPELNTVNGLVHLVHNGTVENEWTINGVQNVDTFTITLGALPITSYQLRLYIDAGAGFVLKDVKNVTTVNCPEPVISYNWFLNPDTTLHLDVFLDADSVPPFGTNLFLTIQNLGTGFMFYDNIVLTQVYGSESISFMLNELEYESLYRVTLRAEGNCGNVTETFLFTTPAKILPDPPVLQFLNWSNPTINSMRVPFTLQGSELMSVRYTLTNTTTSTTLDVDQELYVGIGSGMYEPVFAEYNPGQNFTLTVTVSYVDYPQVTTTENINLFTQQGAVPDVFLSLVSVDTNFAEVSITFSAGGWITFADVLSFTPLDVLSTDYFFLGRNDSVYSLLLFNLEPNTLVTVRGKIISNEFGTRQKEIQFHTLQEEDTTGGGGNPPPPPPITSIKDAKDDIFLNPYGTITTEKKCCPEHLHIARAKTFFTNNFCRKSLI